MGNWWIFFLPAVISLRLLWHKVFEYGNCHVALDQSRSVKILLNICVFRRSQLKGKYSSNIFFMTWKFNIIFPLWSLSDLKTKVVSVFSDLSYMLFIVAYITLNPVLFFFPVSTTTLWVSFFFKKKEIHAWLWYPQDLALCQACTKLLSK